MKTRSKFLFAGIIMASGLAHSQPYEINLVAYKDCHQSVESLDFMAKPQVCNMASQALTYMIEGQDIAVIDKESLELSKLQIGGKDIRFNRKGDKRYKFGSFPKVDENGEYGIFDIELKSAPFGQIGSAVVEGTIDILTSEGVNVEERQRINLNKPFSLNVGPVSIANQSKTAKPKLNKDGLIGEATQVLADGLKEAFMGADKDKLTLYVSGDHDAIVSLDVFENGEKLDQGWYTTGGEERQRTFSKPSNSTVSLKLTYWKGLKRESVTIK